MCFFENKVRNLNQWNWDGDIIIHNPIVPSSRPVVGYSTGHMYDIDVREFLVTDRNATIKKILNKDVIAFLKYNLKGNLGLFRSRRKHSFDYSAYVITAYISETINYLYRKENDYWQFPDETLQEKTGDCDDRALLIASLLIGAGISSFNIRVVLGKVCVSTGVSCKVGEEFDHMWVMYKTEEGQWVLIEPLMITNPEYKKLHEKDLTVTSHLFSQHETTLTVEYIPYFLFNDVHLWGVIHPGKTYNFQEEIKRKRSWSRFHPKFAGEVHRGILHTALKDAPPEIRHQVDSYYSRAALGIAGPIIDFFDRGKYNPLVHFDNCYIKEGWDLVKENLAAFKNSNNENFDSFFKAAHSIADFYAHTSYVHFADIIQEADAIDDYADLYHLSSPQFKVTPDYSGNSDFNLTGDMFTVNKKYWEAVRSKNDIAAEWAGKIISGRYGQPRDTWTGFEAFITEGILSVIPKKLLKAEGFFKRGWVPHHNEIAVDGGEISKSHRLYGKEKKDRMDKSSFENQFHWRWNSAVRHIRKAFYEKVEDLI
ncbi:MAG TPA: transglutaminase-like domain-containing protein [Candidatus Deferrimicrobium sp.]|nr:transglutaminase-like domain-containing protein [Candidatus Deferrimicrobium sp.]